LREGQKNVKLCGARDQTNGYDSVRGIELNV
jgi:hypothetical protein